MRHPKVSCVLLFAALLLVRSESGLAQEDSSQKPGSAPATANLNEVVLDLQKQVSELRAAIAEVHSEAAEYRAEAAALRHELEQLHQNTTPPDMAANSAPASKDRAPDASSLDQRVASLEESQQLLSAKVDEQYQSKVESASKYKVRLSGMVLLNVFSNRGAVDNQDFPSWASATNLYTAGSASGASIRQSELGLEVFGPTLAGARTSGHFQFDFAGGFPDTLNGSNYGILRVRTANLRLDWNRTSLVAGQDELFLSPLSPTSFASVAQPAFSYAGNLWGWIPQVRVEHRFVISDAQNVTIAGGIFDNVDGEPPFNPFNRLPHAGERTRQPAYGSRLAWTHTVHGEPLSFGAAGFYTRQDWGFNRYTDGWAGMADWQIPIVSRLAVSGEFYRGRAVGGLGGGFGRSVLFSGDPANPYTSIRALNSAGGWSQLKVKATSKLEFNGGVGVDNPYSADLHWFPTTVSYYNPLLGQNRSLLANVIYRPRSNLLLSSEYRRLRTFQTDGSSNKAEQVNMIVGVLF